MSLNSADGSAILVNLEPALIAVHNKYLVDNLEIEEPEGPQLRELHKESELHITIIPMEVKMVILLTTDTVSEINSHMAGDLACLSYGHMVAIIGVSLSNNDHRSVLVVDGIRGPGRRAVRIGAKPRGLARPLTSS